MIDLVRKAAVAAVSALILAVAVSPAETRAADTCNGSFVNPIEDICWDCMFPLTVGPLSVVPSDHPDTNNFGSPICLCPMAAPPFVRIGVSIGFWEPVRLIDVAKDPWCFVNIGGVNLDPGFNIGRKTTTFEDGSAHQGQYFVHWYIYPLFYWLELLADFACVEQAAFDVAYISEIDPLWQDDELSYLINPEAALFANPVAQAACVADCTSVSTTGQNIPGLFWCAGCHGSVYPFNGNLQTDTTRIQGALLAAERMTFKLHRQLVAWDTAGPEAICQKQISPIWPRDQYRYQLVNPVPHLSGPGTCPRAGATPISYESGRTYPASGEDVGFLLWRKRTCCAL